MDEPEITEAGRYICRCGIYCPSEGRAVAKTTWYRHQQEKQALETASADAVARVSGKRNLEAREGPSELQSTQGPSKRTREESNNESMDLNV